MPALSLRHGHRTRSAFGLVITFAAITLASLLGSPAQPVHASDPMGVYTLVQDVEVEAAKPGEPERVRIVGITALSYRPRDGGQFRGGLYSNPAAGYLYFVCPDGKAEVCRMEWADLRNAIGDERCAAYGDRYLTDPKPNGRLRPPDEAPDAPDVYPIGQGVTMTQNGMQDTCTAIRELAAAGAVPTVASSAEADSYLPNVAADQPAPGAASADPASGVPKTEGAVASVAEPAVEQDDVSPNDALGKDAAAASEGGGTGPAGPPSLGLLALIGLAALGVATAAAWASGRR